MNSNLNPSPKSIARSARNAVLVLALTSMAFACTKKDRASGDANSNAAATAETAKSATELKIEDQETGKGAEAVPGKKITVHYTGKLTDGTQFDSSVGREPFTFNLGAGQVIEGWEKGFAGMKVGGKRKLTIPPQMGYGERGAGGVIPPNATLVFDVELLKVE